MIPASSGRGGVGWDGAERSGNIRSGKGWSGKGWSGRGVRCLAEDRTSSSLGVASHMRFGGCDHNPQRSNPSSMLLAIWKESYGGRRALFNKGVSRSQFEGTMGAVSLHRGREGREEMMGV